MGIEWVVPRMGRRFAAGVILLPLIAPLLPAQSSLGVAEGRDSRSVTVADAIEMTKFGDPLYWYGVFSPDKVATFSNDDSKFVVPIRKGNLQKNTNEFSLVLWHSRDVFRFPRPDVLVTMSSSSNRPGIQAIKWLPDGNSLLFLGESPGELQQLYSFDVRKRTLRKLTSSDTNLVAYSLNAAGDRIAYFAEQPAVPLFDGQAERKGALISPPMLLDNFVAGIREESWQADKRLFLLAKGATPRQLRIQGTIQFGNGNNVPLLSPDGRYIAMLIWADEVPAVWADYSDRFMKDEVGTRRKPGQHSRLSRYVIIDTATGENRVLFDGPVKSWDTEISWAPDSRSVVIANAFLPLNINDETERRERQNKTFAIEIQIATGEIEKVSGENLELLGWNNQTNRLVFRVGRPSTTPQHGPKVYFERASGGWRKITAAAQQTVARPDITVEEGMETPPKIVAVDDAAKRRSVLMDLNPQFRGLAFGKVEEVKWKGTDGHTSVGGLYYPPDYVRGERYPLVIQTHGWIAKRFWIDGVFATAFAAQPLAAHGIIVLQMAEFGADPNYDWYYSSYNTPKEVSRAAASYEGAIDFLDSRGLIDRERVGIIGFSRTCFYVKYVLTHSIGNFAAASVTDGFDGGYFQYMSYNYADPKAMDGINGASPYGNGLKSWLELSPSFNLEKVRTPVRIMALHPGASEWEWYAALTRLNKPVEMVALRDGEHILQRPLDRMVSLQGNVDWFRFWLQGYEDPDPAKADQYKRWRELKKMQEANQAAQHNN